MQKICAKKLVLKKSELNLSVKKFKTIMLKNSKKLC